MINPLLELTLPNVTWPLLWAGYRLAVLVVLCAWIVLNGQLKRQPNEIHA